MARKRPWISGHPVPDGLLVGGLNGKQRLAAVERTADDDESVIDESVHEGCVRWPAVLLASPASRVPARAVLHRYRKVRHDGRLTRSTDTGPRTMITKTNVASAKHCLRDHGELGSLAPHAVGVWLTASRPSSTTEVCRILNFCTLPVTVIGKLSVTRTYRGIL